MLPVIIAMKGRWFLYNIWGAEDYTNTWRFTGNLDRC